MLRMATSLQVAILFLYIILLRGGLYYQDGGLYYQDGRILPRWGAPRALTSEIQQMAKSQKGVIEQHSRTAEAHHSRNMSATFR